MDLYGDWMLDRREFSDAALGIVDCISKKSYL